MPCDTPILQVETSFHMHAACSQFDLSWCQQVQRRHYRCLHLHRCQNLLTFDKMPSVRWANAPLSSPVHAMQAHGLIYKLAQEQNWHMLMKALNLMVHRPHDRACASYWYACVSMWLDPFPLDSTRPHLCDVGQWGICNLLNYYLYAGLGEENYVRHALPAILHPVLELWGSWPAYYVDRPSIL